MLELFIDNYLADLLRKRTGWNINAVDTAILVVSADEVVGISSRYDESESEFFYFMLDITGVLSIARTMEGLGI